MNKPTKDPTHEITVPAVEEMMRRLFLPGDGAREIGLRKEDLKKSREVAAVLGELSRLSRDEWLVDAAAGHAYVGLLAAEMLGFRRVWLIEREAKRIERCRDVVGRIETKPAPKSSPRIELRAGDVGDAASWPDGPSAVVALHACGAASDAVLDAAAAAKARWIFLVPCCYARSVAFSPRAEAIVDALGVPKQAEVRRRAIEALIDSERTLRLEAAGYEVTVLAFVPPTVTPHNLMWRARRMGEPRRMAAAQAQLTRLRSALDRDPSPYL